MQSSTGEPLYKIKLEVFEGPLDLLLHLIRENEINIYDIPIALITQQYLEYIELIKELNIELAGEFLVMAATLVHIKSKMLLPPSEEGTETEEKVEDPRAELVLRLLEYKRFKEAAEELSLREIQWRDAFPRPSIEPESLIAEGEPMLLDLNLFDLITALKKVIDKVPDRTFYEVTREELSLKDKISMLIDILEEKECITFDELFSHDATRVEVIVTFLALLEVIRLKIARVFQSEDFGIIRISRI
jgi:segregation and condensation protein A